MAPESSSYAVIYLESPTRTFTEQKQMISEIVPYLRPLRLTQGILIEQDAFLSPFVF